MFIYCNNNPVTQKDASGNIPNHCVMLTDTGSKALNSNEPDFTKYLLDQDAPGVGEIPMGAFSTISHGGCGAVATYNALKIMDYDASLYGISKDYMLYFGTNVGGMLGTMPSCVMTAFKSYGFDVVASGDQDTMNILSQKADACILWYAYKTSSFPWVGAHFIAYKRDGDSYLGFNTAEGNGVYAFDDPYQYGTQGNRFYALGIYIFEGK